MPTVPHAPASSAAEHELLVAALDADDLRELDRTRAANLIQTCDGCAQLLGDLAALRAAARVLPSRPRTRDFRLTPADAERLRPTAVRRLLGWLAGPRSTVRPLAGSLAALGVAGLLVASVPGMLGSSASAPAALFTTQGGPSDRNAAGAASAAASVAEGGTSLSGNDAAASAAASQAAVGPVTAPSPAAAPSHEAAPSPASGVPSPASSAVPPPSPLTPSTSGGRAFSEAPSSPIAASTGATACPCDKSATGSTGPAVPPGQPLASTAEPPAGGLPLAPASALLLAAGAALFGARLIARRLI